MDGRMRSVMSFCFWSDAFLVRDPVPTVPCPRCWSCIRMGRFPLQQRHGRHASCHGVDETSGHRGHAGFSHRRNRVLAHTGDSSHWPQPFQRLRQRGVRRCAFAFVVRSLARSPARSLVVRSLARPLVRSFVRSFVCSFRVRLFVRSFANDCSSTRSLTNPLIRAPPTHLLLTPVRTTTCVPTNIQHITSMRTWSTFPYRFFEKGGGLLACFRFLPSFACVFQVRLL